MFAEWSSPGMCLWWSSGTRARTSSTHQNCPILSTVITEEEIKDIKKENADQAILEILKESGIIAKENIVKLIEEGKLKEE